MHSSINCNIPPKSIHFTVLSCSPDDSHGEQQTSSSNRWVVFVSAFIILMINMGFVFSFGTLFSAILEEFQDSRASTAAVQSVFTGIGPSSGTVITVVISVFISNTDISKLPFALLNIDIAKLIIVCNGYTMVCPPVRRDNPRALARGLSPVQADRSWYNYYLNHTQHCRPCSVRTAVKPAYVVTSIKGLPDLSSHLF